MFLNFSPPKLIDRDVNYYGFLESTEYNNWIKSLEGKITTSDIYDSPYFGFQPSGAYRELDSVYELYKSKHTSTTMPIDYFCETGRKLVDGLCVIDSSTYGPGPPTSGISPALILVAAAAFFFAG